MSETRVFLIEDEPDLRRVISRQLKKAGYAVEAAGDFFDALRCLRAGKFDVVVSDVLMPGMTGFEGIEALRRFSDVPIILMSGCADEEMLKDALLLGASELVAKSDGFQALTKAVAACVDSSKHGPQSGA